ncbi:MAG: hypothetical protein CO108_22155 [Deltaproteobacteria bacterium CG_4_9_14_3_um_filter_63_12]|nr:MAG: hypothetical protein CO108_22155 [Deltaproteobacteria bacterium CG_4_9_14_3_um_filter_63_12]
MITVSDGADGGSCSIQDNVNGSRSVVCEDGTDVVIRDGVACWDLNANYTCDNATEDLNGDALCSSADCGAFPPLQPAGVVGWVTDTANLPAAGGTLYFVPAADVLALPATTVAVDSTNDEPLEDTIAANGASYQQALIDSNGFYELQTLSAGTYFVTFIPAVTDTEHLPGGSACRTAVDAAVLAGTRLDVTVSNNAPDDATFVGSGACVSCHGRSHISETMHRIGIWSPTETGALQNLGPRFDDLYMAIEDKFEVVGGTTVYFYDYDATRGMDKYKTSETNPGANVAFTVTVQRNAGTNSLEMVLHNVQNGADMDRTFTVDAIYGGGVMKQRYMTRLTNASGNYLAVLPVQFQHAGREAAPYGRTSKVWRDYHGDFWYDENNDLLKEPGANRSFEKNCISCHAVGSQISGSDATLWKAELVEDTFFGSGDFDYDGNGVADEVNVGCETCHGPGSAHWASAGQGKHIVSPKLLTPEREAMLCGQCHSRPKGALGTDSPVNADGWMMRAGTSRNDFLTDYATTQLDGAASDYYTDSDKHSKSHHQQYSDFIRSAMYKNDSNLLTCSSCHNPHERTDNPRQVIADVNDNVAACGSCHTQAVGLEAHLTAQSIPSAATKASIALCVDCHMTKAAKSGAGQPAKVLNGVQYWANDITSHLFKVPDRGLAVSAGMPVPYTNVCGACHTAAP